MARRTRRQPAQIESLPPHVLILKGVGPETFLATEQLYARVRQEALLLPKWTSEYFPILSDLLQSWSDHEAAQVLQGIQRRLDEERQVQLTEIDGWVRSHHNDSRAVIDCLNIEPPDEISIINLLSRAGSQKLVFLASWRIAQREVVLKRFISEARGLLFRELQPHPLSMVHPNIIETHLLKNSKGEPFLVEKRLSMVLRDAWRSPGTEEAANLLYDIAKALAFLKERQLVHGDIKPDNIGREDESYTLLDFGICRSADAFSEDVEPTGSLRTRAPELLLREGGHTYASDIWALGATVYNALAGRFPLFALGESPPRVSEPGPRSEFETLLAARARDEWHRVDLSVVSMPLRVILQAMLDKRPDSRPDAGGLLKWCESELAAFLRSTNGEGRISPIEQLQQLQRWLPEPGILALMPYSRRQDFVESLSRLGAAKGLASDQNAYVESLLARLRKLSGPEG